MYWPSTNKYFPGTVVSAASNEISTIHYGKKDVEKLNLGCKTWLIEAPLQASASKHFLAMESYQEVALNDILEALG